MRARPPLPKVYVVLPAGIRQAAFIGHCKNQARRPCLRVHIQGAQRPIAVAPAAVHVSLSAAADAQALARRARA